MLRKIIHIDKELCNGCGACARACHEGAIVMQDGVAHLIRDDYCDGLGDCLPACPTGAIRFVTRKAAPYDEQAVRRRLQAKAAGCSCPGSAAHTLRTDDAPAAPQPGGSCPSQLRQWPVQLRLVPPNAPFFDGADLLIAADCSAYACGDFHDRFMRGRVTVIGCPKLDDFDYAEKLHACLAQNDVRSITLVRMQVPCCGGLERAVRKAIEASGKDIPLHTVVLASDGRIVG